MTEPKPCYSVPCPPFQDMRIEVEKCPACGSAQLKWQPDQDLGCDDQFHHLGLPELALPESQVD